MLIQVGKIPISWYRYLKSFFIHVSKQPFTAPQEKESTRIKIFILCSFKMNSENFQIFGFFIIQLATLCIEHSCWAIDIVDI
jgi:hypothetical protein